MSQLALVTPEGLVITNEKPSMVEEYKEVPIHVRAAREAEKQSTKNHQQEK